MADKITVTKDGVTKNVDARLEKDYAKNGWVVRKNETTNPYLMNNNYIKK